MWLSLSHKIVASLKFRRQITICWIHGCRACVVCTVTRLLRVVFCFLFSDLNSTVISNETVADGRVQTKVQWSALLDEATETLLLFLTDETKIGTKYLLWIVNNAVIDELRFETRGLANANTHTTQKCNRYSLITLSLRRTSKRAVGNATAYRHFIGSLVANVRALLPGGDLGLQQTYRKVCLFESDILPGVCASARLRSLKIPMLAVV